jgi:hypothetical protein
MALLAKNSRSADALLPGLAKRAAIAIGLVVPRESLNRDVSGAVQRAAAHSVDGSVIKAMASAELRRIVLSQTGAH